MPHVYAQCFGQTAERIEKERRARCFLLVLFVQTAFDLKAKVNKIAL